MAKPLDRSDIIHVAYKRAKEFNPNDTGNRFKLCREAALGARLIHNSDRRVEDSLNKALMLCGRSAPLPPVRLDEDDELVPLVLR
jgi:hypothetical protein